MPRLHIHHPDGTSTEFKSLGQLTRVGRGPDNTIVLHDSHVSRQHFVIECADGEYVLINRSATHGTLLDGVATDRATLHGGEIITAGDTRIRFAADADARADSALTPILFGREPSAKASPEALPRVLLSSDNSASAPNTLATANPSDSTMMHLAMRIGEKSPPPDIRKRFLLLQDIMQEMVTQLRLHDLLDFILAKVFEVLRADNGAILLIDPEKNLLVPKAVWPKKQGGEGKQLKISRTLIRKVCQEKLGHLCADAQNDEALRGQKSILNFGIRSAMCVPLLFRGEALGVIHIESESPDNTFCRDDLEFLTILANQAAICVRNARLHDEIVVGEMHRANLQRYFSPQVVDQITSNQVCLDLGGNNVEVSLLYSDIRGFTPMAERIPPAELLTFLNAYFSEMAEIVFEYNGSCDKFIGDALLAVFGSPIPDPDHAVHAAHCAEEMIRRIEEMTFTVGPVHIGIGLHCGKVIHGNIGSAKVMQYTVIGDIVNTTARLSDVAGPNQIVMSAALKNVVGNAAASRPLGDMALKGKSEPVETFELLVRRPAS